MTRYRMSGMTSSFDHAPKQSEFLTVRSRNRYKYLKTFAGTYVAYSELD